MDQAHIDRMKEIRQRLLERVEKSATSGRTGRSVEDPRKVAEYVVNALTVHERALLAEAAVAFAYDDVVALLSTEGAG